jgi:hypothetical protein
VLSAIMVLGVAAATLPTASAILVGGLVNPSFEDSTHHHNGWSTAGSSVYTATNNFGMVFSPPANSWQAVITELLPARSR